MTRGAPDRDSRLRIIVLGYVVRGPLGGLAWHHLQYAMGLLRLGHDVYFVEDSGDDPYCCYDPGRDVVDSIPDYGLAFAGAVFPRVGLGERWAYHDAHGSGWRGPMGTRAEELCASADLLLNLSGINPLRPWLADVPRRAFVDTDPGFTQVRHLTEADRFDLARRHTSFHTYAENIGLPACTVPDDGLAWQPTRQPVVLDEWPVTPVPPGAPFTTVMQWDSYPAREYAGRRYGLKSDSFAAVLDLPKRTGAAFVLALGGPGPVRQQLVAKGWPVVDPRLPTRDPWTYQRFIQRSRAEFSVAKQSYTSTRSGWFSERTAAYLASGRPVLVEETGFSDWLEPCPGVVPFSTADEAVAGVMELTAHYDTHRRAARGVAEEYFDARTVLPRLLGDAMGSGTRHAPAVLQPAPAG